jgi:hypothetical protein
MRHGEQREGRLAGQRPDREEHPGGGHAGARPLHAGGAHGDHGRRGDHTGTQGAALQERADQREHHRHAPDDHADRGGIGLAHALYHEHVEQHEPGGRERDETERLARLESRQPPSGDQCQHRCGQQVAQRLARGQGVTLHEVGGRDERADQGQRQRGQHRATQRGAYARRPPVAAASAASAR